MTSSGYGSQAVSTLTLSSEDSASIKSMEEQAGVTAGGDLRPQRKTLTSGENSADSEEMEDRASRDGGDGNPATLVDGEEGEICDHYSQNAMEELERLKIDDEEEEDCAGKQSKPLSSSTLTADDQLNNAPPRPSSNSPLPPLPPASSKSSTVIIPGSKGSKSSPLSSQISPSTSPSSAEINTASMKKSSTPSSGSRRKGSGVRPRPMSMVVSPQAEILTRAWQEDSDGCPGSSEEHLGGKSFGLSLLTASHELMECLIFEMFTSVPSHGLHLQ